MKNTSYASIYPWLAAAYIFLLLLFTNFGISQTPYIRAVMIHPPISGNNEYFEIAGTPGASLDNIWFLVIDGDGAETGKIDAAINLTGYTLGTNGILLCRENALLPDPTSGTNIVSNLTLDFKEQTQTFLLVSGFAGMLNEDLDTSDDAVLDVSPWVSVLCAVSTYDGVGVNSDNDDYADDFAMMSGIRTLSIKASFLPDYSNVPDDASPDIIFTTFGDMGEFIGYGGEVNGDGMSPTGPFTMKAGFVEDYNGNKSLIYENNPIQPGNTGSAVLPIELVAFTGTRVNNAILLKWETASETNNAYMSVERSADGVHFSEIGQQKAHGNGNSRQSQFYTFTDLAPLPGINYYRLRQVDKDERFDYQLIIAVSFSNKSNAGFRLYPTLVQDELILQLDKTRDRQSLIYVSDATGRRFLQQSFAADAEQQRINVTSLPVGTYFVTLHDTHASQTLRFVKI